jgi:hypothetical protein
MAFDLKKSLGAWTPQKGEATASENIKQALQALTDTTYRGGVAGLAGAPMDMTNMLTNALRTGSNQAFNTDFKQVENPVGGSEWIGQQLQNAGIVSPTRRPIGELLAGLVDPATMGAAAVKGAAMIPALGRLQDAATAAKLDPSLIKVADNVIHYPDDWISKLLGDVRGDVASHNATEMLGLPADASRMDRAVAGGFDTPAYHGTDKVFDNFQKTAFDPTFFSPDARLANQFSQMSGNGVPKIIPVKLAKGKVFDFRKKEHIDDLEEYLASIGAEYTTDNMNRKIKLLDGVRSGDFNMVENLYAKSGLKKKGYDSFLIREVPEKTAFADADRAFTKVFPDTEVGKREAMSIYNAERERWKQYGDGLNRTHPDVKKTEEGYQIGYQGETFSRDDIPNFASNRQLNMAVFEPKNIRSRFAQFDPAKKDSSNLLASLLAGTVVGKVATEKSKEKKDKKL